jgi:hypothetical protein
MGTLSPVDLKGAERANTSHSRSGPGAGQDAARKGQTIPPNCPETLSRHTANYPLYPKPGHLGRLNPPTLSGGQVSGRSLRNLAAWENHRRFGQIEPETVPDGHWPGYFIWPPENIIPTGLVGEDVNTLSNVETDLARALACPPAPEHCQHAPVPETWPSWQSS